MRKLLVRAVVSLAFSVTTSITLPAQDLGSADTVTGFVKIPSNHSVAVTLDRLESEVRSRGMKVFARIDFSSDAEAAGLEMRPTQLMIFGNPHVGTPLMIARPSVAIDLPLKALAWEDDEGTVWLAYNSPRYLMERHRLAAEMVKKLAAVESLLSRAAE